MNHLDLLREAVHSIIIGDISKIPQAAALCLVCLPLSLTTGPHVLE